MPLETPSRGSPALESIWNLELSPAQQLDALVEIFVAGKLLSYDTQFKDLTKMRDGVVGIDQDRQALRVSVIRHCVPNRP